MRYLIIASLLLTAPLVIEQMTGIPFGSSIFAADKKPEKRRVPPLKERIYKTISEAQLLIDPDAVPVPEGEEKPDVVANPQEAIRMMLKVLERPKRLNAYEIAQLWNTLAYAYYTLEDIPNTLRAYEKVLAQPQMQISLGMELSASNALFRLYYQREDYRKSISYMEHWESINATRDAGVAYLKATAYYQMGEYRTALTQALLVEEIAIETEKTMKEDWLYFYVILYSELKDDDNVIKVLERLILTYPKKQYWMHLATLYGEKGWDDKALSAFYAAYIQGMFGREIELVMLSQRLLNAEVPYEATVVLEKGFDEDIIEKNEKNIRLLATSYTMAQEFSKAIDAWREATDYAEDGEIYFRLAQALSTEDRHEEAIKSYRNALKEGDLKNPEDVNYWMGISLMQEQQWSAATKAFRIARKDKKKAKSSGQMLKYIVSERKRLKALAEMAAAD
ncbi:MAG: hypothetical protein ABGY96_20090 [bacterium]|nr:hypothetical protein [Gammaproteobacteria bacterium]HIL95231.1 hypothetical protein [Pseudomonadales bacterium]